MPGVLDAADERSPIQWVASHTPKDWRKIREAAEEVNGEERLNQLRARGYLEDVED